MNPKLDGFQGTESKCEKLPSEHNPGFCGSTEKTTTFFFFCFLRPLPSFTCSR